MPCCSEKRNAPFHCLAEDRLNDGQVKFNVEYGPMGCMGFDVVGVVSNQAVGVERGVMFRG